MKQHLIAISTLCTVIFAGASSALEEEVECADVALEACTASFTSVPDFVIPGEPLEAGTCVHGGQGPGGTPPTDKLEATVAPLPACEDCEVIVTATWGAPQAGTHVSAAKTEPWPHPI